MKFLRQEMIKTPRGFRRRWVMECPVCGKATYLTPAKAKTQKTCSYKCRNQLINTKKQQPLSYEEDHDV